MSDGCTGFWFFQSLWSGLTNCCYAHDMGMSDGWLLDCVRDAVPPWAYASAAFCVALMVLFRPIYRFLKRVTGAVIAHVFPAKPDQ